jgi:predicted MPP superfamily phosphohydrolase
MAIIIGDLHGDLAMARAFLKYRPTDTHVALGDLVDSRAKSDLDEEMACLDLLLNSPSVLIWGNHDLAYLPEQPWSCFGRFGEMAHREQYQAHRDRFVAAVAVDGWLLSHGGVSPRLAKLMPTEVLAGGAERIAPCVKIVVASIARRVNCGRRRQPNGSILTRIQTTGSRSVTAAGELSG